MRNAVIVFTLFLATGVGLGCSARDTDGSEGFLANSGAVPSRGPLTLLHLQKSSNLSLLIYQQRKWQLRRHPGGGPIRKKIQWKNSRSRFLVDGPHRADRSSSNGVSARVLLLDPTVPLLRMPT